MKNLYVTLVLVFGLQICFGQIGFESVLVYDDDNYLNTFGSVASGDLDNDGDLDLVATGYNGSKLVWYENLNGLGAYGINKLIDDNIGIESVIKIYDINGDGNLDVVTKNTWYENLDGLGDFSLPNMFVTDESNSIAAEDIDGDGDLDLFNAKTWFKNMDGQGNFEIQQTFVSGTIADYVDSSIPGDIDNDGDIDIITTLISQNKIVWYENLDGLGNFDVAKTISNADDPRYIAVGDVDGDNDLDVVSLSSGDGRLRRYRNSGNGASWSTLTVYTNSSANFRGVNLADIDNDGDADISIAIDTDNYRWFENSGSGSFQQRLTPSGGSEFVINVDVDGDNDLDLVRIDKCSQKLEWHPFPYTDQNNPNSINVAKDLGELGEVYFEDIDNDGDLDVISDFSNFCSSTGAKNISWFENIDGYITNEPVIEVLNLFVDNLQFSDIDNDGDLDILALRKLNNKIYIRLNLNNGQDFEYNGTIDVDYPSSSTETEAFLLSDMNNDGYDDLITFINNETVWLQNVDGNFMESNPIITGNYKYLRSFDFDNDFDNDILFVRGSTVGWFENLDGLGLFSGEIIIDDIATDVGLIEGSDLDNDQDVDLIVYLPGDDNLVYYENLGSGSFDVQQLIFENFTTFTNTVSNIQIADMNEDGKLDIISGLRNNSTGADTIFWYENLGIGQGFGNQQGISNIKSQKIVVKDFDSDGDSDVLSASNNGSIINIYKNLGVLGNEIRGNVKFDIQGNDCLNNGVNISNIKLVSDNGSDIFSTFTTVNGNYQLSVNQGDFITELIPQFANYFSISPNEPVSNFEDIGNVDTINFCVIPISSVNDLNISIYPSINDPRPGFDTTYQLVYNNIGTTQLSGSVSFEFDDSKLQFLTASETVTSPTANTLNFDFTDLNPFETRTIDLEFNVFAPPTTNIDDILVSTTTVNPVSNDETEDDNVFTLEQTVIGSYDPNDIAVLEGEQILIEDADKYLHYLIRFQNTGTASAINVRVDNVLDDKLDWTTMQLESLSHDGRVEIIDQTDVSFIFNNINLADSTNDEPNSHGFIAYKIKPKDDVVLGDIFFNTADIFFDFNPPITTNTVSTEIVETLSVDDFESNLFSVYPNPTNSELTVNSTYGFDSLTIIDINGRTLNMVSNKNRELNMFINVEDFANGIYFLKIKAANTEQTLKFIKN